MRKLTKKGIFIDFNSQYCTSKEEILNSKIFVSLLERYVKRLEKKNIHPSMEVHVGDDIENKISSQMKREIKSVEIGEYVMDGLKELDEVSYVRFASVYRQFKDASTFVEEIQKLLNQ